jgi:hypothetical protein
MGQCFGCGGDFERALLEDVGDQLFCRLCLGRLLRRVEERGADAAPSAASPSPVAAEASTKVVAIAPVTAAAPAEAPCFLCGGPLRGEAFVRLRGFAICNGCSRALAGEGPDGDGEAGASEVASASMIAATPEPEPATPGADTAWCDGCGRAMPGPGSYRVVEGRALCPACAAAQAARAPARRTGAGDPCDACRRLTASEQLRPTRGFRLCLACLESDPELAIALAQARHRRRLARQGRRLLDEGDDD